MKRALIAVAVTALMGGLVIGPATQQSAKVQAFTALNSIGTGGDTTADGINLILAGHGVGEHPL